MAIDDRAGGARSHLFAVRVWKEQVTDGAAYRGYVRDVVSGAFRNFRTWPDLTAFVIACVDEDEDDAPGGARGKEARWP